MNDNLRFRITKMTVIFLNSMNHGHFAGVVIQKNNGHFRDGKRSFKPITAILVEIIGHFGGKLVVI